MYSHLGKKGVHDGEDLALRWFVKLLYTGIFDSIERVDSALNSSELLIISLNYKKTLSLSHYTPKTQQTNVNESALTS